MTVAARSLRRAATSFWAYNPPVNSSRVAGRFARALSLRVIVICLIGGVGFGVLAGLVWPAATIPVMWIAAAGLYAIAVLNDDQMTKCPACGKRVKLGATRCHHCGYQVIETELP